MGPIEKVHTGGGLLLIGEPMDKWHELEIHAALARRRVPGDFPLRFSVKRF
jgi:hypothetical protein